jgi:hypothetical protein
MLTRLHGGGQTRVNVTTPGCPVLPELLDHFSRRKGAVTRS